VFTYLFVYQSTSVPTFSSTWSLIYLVTNNILVSNLFLSPYPATYSSTRVLIYLVSNLLGYQ